MVVAMPRILAPLLSMSRVEPILGIYGVSRPRAVRNTMRRRLRLHWADEAIRLWLKDGDPLLRLIALDEWSRHWGGQAYLWTTACWFLARGRGTSVGLSDRMKATFVALGRAGEADDIRSAIEVIEAGPSDAWERRVVADPASIWNDAEGVAASIESLLRIFIFAESWRSIEASFSETDISVAIAWVHRQAEALDQQNSSPEWEGVHFEFPRLVPEPWN